MPSERPPTIDPVAAALACGGPAHSPWLHEEVARRMEGRLQWIREAPAAWCDWDAVRGGLQAHALVRQRYPDASCFVVETSPHPAGSGCKGAGPALVECVALEGQGDPL